MDLVLPLSTADHGHRSKLSFGRDIDSVLKEFQFVRRLDVTEFGKYRLGVLDLVFGQGPGHLVFDTKFALSDIVLIVFRK